MTTVQPLTRSETVALTDSVRRFSLVSQTSSRGSRKEKMAHSSTSGSNFTAESSSNSSRPSISESGRRKSSLASLSSVLKKSKRKFLATALEDESPTKQDETNSGQALTLGESFLGLPTEIQTIILSYLSTTEILSFRRVTKSCLAVIQANSSTITRNILRPDPDGDEEEEEECTAEFLVHLYPSTFSSTSTDAYMLRTLRRKLLIERQLKVLLTFIQTRVYMLKLTKDLDCEHFAPYRPGLRRLLYRPVGYLQHLLETIRHLIIRSHPRHLSPNLTIDLCPACKSSLDSVITSYPSDILVSTYQILQLLVQHMRNATRSPSSVTAFERKLRGWGYGPPPEEHMAQLVMLGGLSELCKIDEMQGSYSKRLSIVKAYADLLAEATRINEIAFPDIYKSRTDPVLSSTTAPISRTTEEQYAENLHTAIEAHADTHPLNPTTTLSCPLALLTEPILLTVPRLDALLIGPNTPLARRIKKEKLINHDRELISPYGWVTKTMAKAYVPEDFRALRPTMGHEGMGLGGLVDHHHSGGHGHHYHDQGDFGAGGGHSGHGGGHWSGGFGGGDGGGGGGGGGS